MNDIARRTLIRRGLLLNYATIGYNTVEAVVSLIAGYLIHKAYGLVFEYSWTWALVAAAIGVLGGILGALYPAWRASNLDPVNALAYE